MKFDLTKINFTSGRALVLLKICAALVLIGFLAATAAVIIVNQAARSRDAVREGAVATINRALAVYLKDSPTGYPASTGECLSADAGVGAELKAARVLTEIPLDPLWPETAPAAVNGGYAVSPSSDFCFYYFSGAPDRYQISYFLEADSGRAGIATTGRE